MNSRSQVFDTQFHNARYKRDCNTIIWHKRLFFKEYPNVGLHQTKIAGKDMSNWFQLQIVPFFNLIFICMEFQTILRKHFPA